MYNWLSHGIVGNSVYRAWENCTLAFPCPVNGFTEEDRRVQKILREHYDKVYKENLSHSDPMAYIQSKYCDVTSSINPYTYQLSVSGNGDKDILSLMERLLEYAGNGWNEGNDLVLEIGFDSSGLYDIGRLFSDKFCRTEWRNILY